MAEHGCRAEPHCVCGDNAWYHEDEPPHRCHQQDCACLDYQRCVSFVSCLGLPARVPEKKICSAEKIGPPHVNS